MNFKFSPAFNGKLIKLYVSVKELYPSKLKEEVAAETFLDVIL